MSKIRSAIRCTLAVCHGISLEDQKCHPPHLHGVVSRGVKSHKADRIRSCVLSGGKPVSLSCTCAPGFQNLYIPG